MKNYGKTKLDEKLEEVPGYIKMVRSVMYKMFDIDSKDVDARKVYIDVNSCASILFRADDINDPELMVEVQKILEKFINREIDNRTQLVFLFTLEPSSAHVSLYEDWCKKRYERVAILKSSFLRNFLMAVKKYQDTNSSIKIVNTHKVHPALVVYHNEYKTKKGFIVLSKDMVFQSLGLEHGYVFNGVNLILTGDPKRELPDMVDLEDPDIMMPYYLSLAGSSREEFPGLKGYGPHKASKYCNLNRIKIKMGMDHDLKEHMDKYSVLFDIRKLMEVNKEDIVII